MPSFKASPSPDPPPVVVSATGSAGQVRINFDVPLNPAFPAPGAHFVRSAGLGRTVTGQVIAGSQLTLTFSGSFPEPAPNRWTYTAGPSGLRSAATGALVESQTIELPFP